MLHVLGSHERLCNRWTRRDVLAVGGLTPLSLEMANLLRLQHCQAAQPERGKAFGQAKRIILLYLTGAASQYETFDPKPEAPAEIRGEFGTTETAIPGVRICDRLPKIAQIADRVTIIRSMSHPHNNHSNVYTLTGRPAVDFGSETSPYDHRHWPFFGSMLQYLTQRKDRVTPLEIPNNIALPFLFSSRGLIKRGGPYAGFLGRTFDPVWTEFEGTPTKTVLRDNAFGGKSFPVQDPFLGITPNSRLALSRGGTRPPEITLDRLNGRRSLRDQLDTERRSLDASLAGQSFDRFQELAYSLITSKKVSEALDVHQESMSTRKRYGMTLFGQATLAGRRLLEAGAPMVTVMWDEVVAINSAWDTHFRLFSRLGDELLPGLDGALSALVTDLDDRGMLDETLVLCLTEHGRTDKIVQRDTGPGRDHSSSVYSILLAGGGIGRGRVIGASDARGANVKNTPISPEDILATMYHLMGIDHEMTIPDRLERPVPLVADGRIIESLLG